MLTQYRKHLTLLTLFALLLLPALPSSAELFEISFGGYPNFTNINNVNIPGVTFIASPTATVMTDGETGIEIWGGVGVDLIIRFDRPNDSVRLTANGFGSCQEDPDTLKLFHEGMQVHSMSIYKVPEGRCTTTIYRVETLFQEIHIDVDEEEGMEIWNLDVNIASLVTEFTDGRINSRDAGSPVVLYPVDYGEGLMGLHIYAADGSGLILEISPDEIPAECPESNSLIAEDEASGLQLYRLAADAEGSCAFQLVAPTSEAGKFYYVIFDAISVDSDYQSWEE